MARLPPKSMSQKTKVLLVDDHPVVREWLAHLINQQSDLQICGETDCAPKALQMMGTMSPDIAIVDLSMKGGSGLELIKDTKASHPAVLLIVLSMHDEAIYAERALRAGARGYIMKREATKKILQAIRCVLGGQIYLSDRMARMMAERFVAARPGTEGSLIENLSDRELEVFRLLGSGYSARQIADDLHISFKTVYAFCDHIKEKLKLVNAHELFREALRWHESRHKT
jgi:DNA-binding NarL/FixJ family response regulator